MTVNDLSNILLELKINVFLFPNSNLNVPLKLN
jgi:hypothetical protein